MPIKTDFLKHFGLVQYTCFSTFLSIKGLKLLLCEFGVYQGLVWIDQSHTITQTNDYYLRCYARKIHFSIESGGLDTSFSSPSEITLELQGKAMEI